MNGPPPPKPPDPDKPGSIEKWWRKFIKWLEKMLGRLDPLPPSPAENVNVQITDSNNTNPGNGGL